MILVNSRRFIPTSLALIVGLALFPELARADNSPPLFASDFKMQNFYKGNLHNHIWTDHNHIGQKPRDKDVKSVANWYRQNGYHFLALTDHLYGSVPGDYAELEDDSFIFLHGEEANISKHMLTLCSQGETIGNRRAPLKKSVEIIKASGATAVLAHPKYSKLKASDISNMPLIEFYNAATGSSEELWAEVLDNGEHTYAIAVDDNHGVDGADKPGLAWVQVAANELRSASICAALEAGQFYASTGVNLQRITVRSDKMYIVIAAAANDQPTDFVTEFIGKNSKILKKVVGYYPSFALSASDTGYIRARIVGPAGTAWVQPVFINSARKSN